MKKKTAGPEEIQIAQRVEALSLVFNQTGLGTGTDLKMCHRPCSKMRRKADRGSSNEVRCELMPGEHCYVGTTMCERGR